MTDPADEQLNRWQTLKVSVILTFVAHMLAGLTMAAVLSQGLETNTNVPARLSFIVENRGLWIVSWITWNLASLSILNFYLALVRAHEKRFSKQLLYLAMAVAAAAMAADLSAESIEMGLIPGLAADALKSISNPSSATALHMELFFSMHRLVVLLTGFVANALYTVSAGFIAWAIRSHYPSWVNTAALLLFATGLAESVTALADSTQGMLWTNALLMPIILAWQIGILLDARRQLASPHD